MSSRLHNKFHRHNHHTNSTNDPRYPDASYDPIASYTSNFSGPFVVKNPNSPDLTTQSTTNTPNVAIDVAGDIAATGNIYAAGAYYGDGSQLALGNNTSLIATVTGTPYTFGATNPVTSIVTSLSSAGNAARASYSTVAGGSANQINGSANFSFIAGGSANSTNVPNTFILGSNIIATSNQPNYTYVNNLSSLGFVYATVIGASAINAINFVGNGNGINLSTSSLSATTTTLVNNTSSNLVTLTNTTSSNLVTLTNTVSGNLVTLTNNTSANLVTLTNTVSTSLNNSITGLQTLSGNWQSTYSLFSTTTATTFNVKGLSATGLISASAFNASNGFYSTSAFSGTYTDGIVTDYVTGLGRISVGSNDALAFYNGGPANTATVMVCANGNVGIGTTVPNQNLTVVGNISATGTLTTNSVNVSGNVNAGNIYSNGVLLANSTGSVQSSYATNPGLNPNNIIQIPILAGHRYAVEAWASNSTGSPTSNWTIGLSSTNPNPAFAPFASLYAVGVYSNSTNYTGTATSTVTYGVNGSVTGFTLPSVAQASNTYLFAKLNVIFSSLVNSTITLLLSGKNIILGTSGEAYMSVTQLS